MLLTWSKADLTINEQRCSLLSEGLVRLRKLERIQSLRSFHDSPGDCSLGWRAAPRYFEALTSSMLVTYFPFTQRLLVTWCSAVRYIIAQEQLNSCMELNDWCIVWDECTFELEENQWTWARTASSAFSKSTLGHTEGKALSSRSYQSIHQPQSLLWQVSDPSWNSNFP